MIFQMYLKLFYKKELLNMLG